jgi:O-antigen/teichoic acid export membrane protein
MAGYYALQGNFTLGAVFAAVALFIPVLEPGALYSSYLNGLKRFRQWSLLDIFSQLGATALIVATIFFTDSVLLIALAYLVSYGIARTVATGVVRRSVPPAATEDPDLLRYSKSVSLFQIVSRVTASIDQIVLYHLLGPVQVALFALASAVPNRIQSLLRIGGIIAFPKLAERSMDDIRRALPRKLLLLTLAIAAAAGLYILAAPYLFAWFFPKYLPALGYSKVLVLYTFSALTYPISAAFFAHKNVTPGYAMSIVNLGVKVVALAVFVPLVGIWGAVISTLAASASTIVIAGYYLLRRSRVQPQPLG